MRRLTNSLCLLSPLLGTNVFILTLLRGFKPLRGETFGPKGFTPLLGGNCLSRSAYFPCPRRFILSQRAISPCRHGILIRRLGTSPRRRGVFVRRRGVIARQ